MNKVQIRLVQSKLSTWLPAYQLVQLLIYNCILRYWLYIPQAWQSSQLNVICVVSVQSLLWQFTLCCVSSVSVATVCQYGHKQDKFLNSIPCVWPATVERSSLAGNVLSNLLKCNLLPIRKVDRVSYGIQADSHSTGKWEMARSTWTHFKRSFPARVSRCTFLSLSLLQPEQRKICLPRKTSTQAQMKGKAIAISYLLTFITPY